jgi:hypothetical protein
MRPRTILLGAAVPALLAGVVVLGSGGPAQSQAVRTISLKELDKGSTFVHIRNTKSKSRQGNAQGDSIVFTNPLTDASGKAVGKLYASCATTVGARDFMNSVITCNVILTLADGTLTGQANVSPGRPRTLGAVTGGTGAYANARGVVESVPTKAGSADTITLVG